MLRLDKISFAASGRKILDQISLEIPEGKFLVITGPNGSGKSTLAKIMMGILEPTSGKVLLDGEDITEKNVTERAQLGLSFAFQQPVKIKGLTVRDLLEIAIEKSEGVEETSDSQETRSAVSSEKSKLLPETYLKLVGLKPEDYLDRELSGGLSGGELKRIEIASVLARGSKYMIFDEPEAGIDLWSFADLTVVFRKFRKGKTIIIISHQERILKLADEVLVIEKGKIARRGAPEKILKELA